MDWFLLPSGCLSRGFYQDWKSLKTHIYLFYIIAYNDEFYLPKSFTQLDSEDIFSIGRYFLMMLKKKEALFQNKQTPSKPAVAYYMLLINIDLAWKGIGQFKLITSLELEGKGKHISL